MRLGWRGSFGEGLAAAGGGEGAALRRCSGPVEKGDGEEWVGFKGRRLGPVESTANWGARWRVSEARDRRNERRFEREGGRV
jgi:hypothetical protein